MEVCVACVELVWKYGAIVLKCVETVWKCVEIMQTGGECVRWYGDCVENVWKCVKIV